MTRFPLAALLLLPLLVTSASALSFSSTPGSAIPDNDPAGVLDTIDTSGAFAPTDLVSWNLIITPEPSTALLLAFGLLALAIAGRPRRVGAA